MTEPTFNLFPAPGPARYRSSAGPMVSMKSGDFGCSFNTAAFDAIGLQSVSHVSLEHDPVKHVLVFNFHNDALRPGSFRMPKRARGKGSNGKSRAFYCKGYAETIPWLFAIWSKFTESQRFDLKRSKEGLWYIVVEPPKQGILPYVRPGPKRKPIAEAVLPPRFTDFTPEEQSQMLAQFTKSRR